MSTPTNPGIKPPKTSKEIMVRDEMFLIDQGTREPTPPKIVSLATKIDEYILPGCLEIPLAARDLLAEDARNLGDLPDNKAENKIDAIVCFGIIVKGDTLHFEMISEESMRGLGSVMHDFRRPILVEILPVFEMQQAIDRSSNDEFNKGIEAAVAAIEMVAWRRSICS